MNDFSYVAPTSLAHAISLLGEHGSRARCLAGGTDLIVQLREHLKSAEVVIDVKHVPELMALDFDPKRGLHLGSATPCYKIYEHEGITQAYGALADAARIIGGWQIQSRASIGGNLCNSSPAADSIPALIALDARCHISGQNETRAVQAAEFCTAPGKNILKEGELLTALEFPAKGPHSGSHYRRFIPRNEMDIAVVGVAASVRLEANHETIAAARIALGAVAPTPLFAKDASQLLIGKPANAESFAAAAKEAVSIARPISDMRGPADYRLHLVQVLTVRVLEEAVRRAKTA